MRRLVRRGGGMFRLDFWDVRDIVGGMGKKRGGEGNEDRRVSSEGRMD